jgi:tetratricopeptide (TPR) repeat protein
LRTLLVLAEMEDRAHVYLSGAGRFLPFGEIPGERRGGIGLVLATTGLLEVAQRKIEEAKASFAGVIYCCPLWAEPRTLHGATRWLQKGVYSEKGQGEAIYDFEEAIALEWRSPEALVARGALRLNSGRDKEALADAEAAMKLRPDDPIFMFLYGQALLENKRMEGIQWLLKAEQAFLHGGSGTFLGRFLTPLANVARGEAHLMMGRVAEAEQAFQAGMEGYFAESEAQFGLAKVCLAKKDYDRAWSFLKRSKSSSSELVGKRDWDEVVRALEAASGKSAADMLK